MPMMMMMRCPFNNMYGNTFPCIVRRVGFNTIFHFSPTLLAQKEKEKLGMRVFFGSLWRVGLFWGPCSMALPVLGPLLLFYVIVGLRWGFWGSIFRVSICDLDR